MIDPERTLGMIIELCERLSIAVREEHLGGDGGGLCVMRDRRLLFVDLDADTATRLHQCANALANLPELEQIFVPPALRQVLSEVRSHTHEESS
jgi:hypothetical protein